MATVRPPQDYVLDLFQPLIDRQEWDDSGSVSERVLRSYLLLFSCYRNYPPCVARATRLFEEWKDSDGTMQSVTNKQTPLTVLIMVTTPCLRLNVKKKKKIKKLFVFSLPVDITMAVFVIGARTPEGWDFLFEKYRTSLQMSVRSRMKSAMSTSQLQDKLSWYDSSPASVPAAETLQHCLHLHDTENRTKPSFRVMETPKL